MFLTSWAVIEGIHAQTVQAQGDGNKPRLLTIPSQLRIGDPPVTVQVKAFNPERSVTISSNSGSLGVYIALQSGCGGVGAGSVTVSHNDVVHLVGCNATPPNSLATLTVREVDGQTETYSIAVVEPGPTEVCRPSITDISSTVDSVSITRDQWPSAAQCIAPDEYLVIYQTDVDTRVPILASLEVTVTNTIGYQHSSESLLVPDSNAQIFLKPGTEYTFYLQGLSRGISGAYSIGRTVRTGGMPPAGGVVSSNAALDPPTFVGHDPNALPGQVRVLWRPPLTGEPRNYAVQFHGQQILDFITPLDEVVEAFITPLGGNSITPGGTACTHLTSGDNDCTDFTFQGFVSGERVLVSTVAVYDQGATSRPVTFWARAGVGNLGTLTPKVGPPQDWGYVTQGLDDGQALLLWRPPDDGSVTGYTLQLRTANSDRWHHPVNAIIAGETGYTVSPRRVHCRHLLVTALQDCTDFLLSGLEPGARYFVQVRAWSFQQQTNTEWREWELVTSGEGGVGSTTEPGAALLDIPFEFITLISDQSGQTDPEAAVGGQGLNQVSSPVGQISSPAGSAQQASQTTGSPREMSIDLQWKRIPDAERYRVEYMTEPTRGWQSFPVGDGSWQSFPGGERVANTAVSCRPEKNVSPGFNCVRMTAIGFDPDSVYYFRVQAQNASKESRWAYYTHDPSGFTVAGSSHPLPRPFALVQVGAADNNVTLQWSWASDNPNDKFHVQYEANWPDTSTGGWFDPPAWRNIDSRSVDNTSTPCKTAVRIPFDPDDPPTEDGSINLSGSPRRCIEFRITDLESGTRHPIRVRAVKGAAESSWVGGLNALTVGPNQIAPVEPPKPLGLTQTEAGDGTITVQWRPPVSLTPSHYIVTYEAWVENEGISGRYRFDAPGGNNVSPGSEPCLAGMDGTHVNSDQEDCTEFTVVGLERSRRYPILVVAVTSLGSSEPATVLAVSGDEHGLVVTGRLQPPRNLTLYDAPQSDSLDLIWLDPPDGKAEHYDVEVRPFWEEEEDSGDFVYPDGHLGDEVSRDGRNVPRWQAADGESGNGPCVSRYQAGRDIRPDTEPDTVNCTRFVITGLEDDTRYLVRVRNVRGPAHSDPADRVFRTANIAGRMSSNLPAPRNLLTRESHLTSLELQWDNPPGIDHDSLSHYSLEYGESSGAYQTANDRIFATTDGGCFGPEDEDAQPTPVRDSDNVRPTCTQYTVENLKRGTSYSIRVQPHYHAAGGTVQEGRSLHGTAKTEGTAAADPDDPDAVASSDLQIYLYPSDFGSIRENEYLPVQVVIENGDMNLVRIIIRPSNQQVVQVARGSEAKDFLDSMARCKARYLADNTYYAQEQQMFEAVRLSRDGSGTDEGQWFCLRAGEIENNQDRLQLVVEYDGDLFSEHELTVVQGSSQVARWFTVYPWTTIFVRGQTYPISFEFADDWDLSTDSKLELWLSITSGMEIMDSHIAIAHLGTAGGCHLLPDNQYGNRTTVARTSSEKEVFCLKFGDDVLDQGDSFTLNVTVTQPYNIDPTQFTSPEQMKQLRENYQYVKTFSPIRVSSPLVGQGPASAEAPEPNPDACTYENDVLCLQPWIAQICMWAGMSCDSRLFFQIMVAILSAFIATIPLFASWARNGILTPLHVGFSFFLLLSCMVLGHRILGLPTYLALVPILPVLVIAAIYFARRVQRESAT